MKNKMIPDYPIMYKMNFTNGRLMKFQFDDFLFLYVISHGEFHASSTYPHIGRGCNRISVTCYVSGYDRCRK